MAGRKAGRKAGQRPAFRPAFRPALGRGGAGSPPRQPEFVNEFTMISRRPGRPAEKIQKYKPTLRKKSKISFKGRSKKTNMPSNAGYSIFPHMLAHPFFTLSLGKKTFIIFSEAYVCIF